MPAPKKQANGRWKVRVYDYQDADGKQHYKSFTADSKSECNFLAAEYMAKKKRIEKGDLTIGEILDQYIDSLTSVLSPSTIRGYRSQRRNYYAAIESRKLKDVNSTILQVWINDFSRSHSPKTVANAHGLLNSSIAMANPDFSYNVRLPEKRMPDLYLPNNSDIKNLLACCTDPELKAAIYLGAYGPLRRGEICALEYKDITGTMISINKSMVFVDIDKRWIIKQPKTSQSYRTIVFSQSVIDAINEIEYHDNGFVFSINPNMLTSRFERLVQRCCTHTFRFHDLRHYSASIQHAIGIPDQYIMQRGGWSTDGVMKKVYRDAIDEQTKKMNDKINEYFQSLE